MKKKIYNTTSTTNGAHLVYGGSNLVYGGSTMNYIHLPITTYHVLGEDIQVEDHSDPHLVVVISTLNVLGKPFYDELRKNNLSFPSEIEEYLEIKFKVLERDRKIKDILKS
jgi:hypothetical protein